MQNLNKAHNNIFCELYSIYIGLLPFIMVYKLPFVDFGLGVLLALLFLPYLAICATKRNIKIFSISSILLLSFFLYYAFSISTDFNGTVLILVTAVHVLLAPKSLNFEKFVRVVKLFALISSVVIIFQYIIYAISGVFISFIWDDFVLTAFKGTSGISMEEGNGFARISGFFLEPSHYSKYALVALSFCLFENRITSLSLRKAIILTLGIIMSTSGMGLVGAFGIWVYYIVVKDKFFFKNQSKVIKVLSMCFIGSVLISILYFSSSGFQHSIMRIIGSSNDYNAIDGRILYTESYLALLSSNSDWLFGIHFFEIENYVVGYVKILVFSGITGLSLLILASISLLFKNRLPIKVIIITFIVLLFFSDIVGGLYLIFYYVMFNNKYIYEK